MIGKNPPRTTGRISATEFTKLCESIWGARWKTAASGILKREPRTLDRYGNGQLAVPWDVEANLRQFADIGLVAEVVKAAMVKFLSQKPPTRLKPQTHIQKAHLFAISVAVELRRRKLLKIDGDT